jgi:NAD(P)H-nitrite reductase large subunit
MILDGTKGAVIQRGFRTYGISPHLPCGTVTPDMLRRIADVADKYGATLKCTSAQRIAILGIKEQDIDEAWKALGGERPGHLFGNVVRSVRACPGTEFCKRARQDSLGLGLELDRLYHGKPLPGKMKIGVSGCPNQCAETAVKDIGLVGGVRGWSIVGGGACGSNPRLAKELTETEVSRETALEIVAQLIAFFEKNARQDERLGDVIARVGMDALRQAVRAA